MHHMQHMQFFQHFEEIEKRALGFLLYSGEISPLSRQGDVENVCPSRTKEEHPENPSLGNKVCVLLLQVCIQFCSLGQS